MHFFSPSLKPALHGRCPTIRPPAIYSQAVVKVMAHILTWSFFLGLLDDSKCQFSNLLMVMRVHHDVSIIFTDTASHYSKRRVDGQWYRDPVQRFIEAPKNSVSREPAGPWNNSICFFCMLLLFYREISAIPYRFEETFWLTCFDLQSHRSALHYHCTHPAHAHTT